MIYYIYDKIIMHILYINIFLKDVTIIKKLFKLLISSVLCTALSLCGSTVHAQEINSITLLGDSITTGYGLSDDEMSYGDYLKSYFNSEIDNFAVNGLKTDELLVMLDEYETQTSIQQADLVCISIGGNDFLSVLEQAVSDMGGSISMDNGTVSLNISSDFISKFILDYSSALSAATTQASDNIKKIRDKVNEINPDAEIIMQTVYNPFDSSDEETSKLISPLKTFAPLYLSTINNSIKESSPNTADIYLKFYENSYLYTNMNDFDIHPNAVGHMLIAEEIVQVIGESGDFTVFSEEIYKIPQGVFSEFPDYTAEELEQFSLEQLRRGTLEQSISRAASADASVQTEASQETETADVSDTTEETQQHNDDNKTKSKSNKILSRIFLITGFSIILFVTLLKFIRERNKNK